MRRRVIFLFLDGVGLGPDDPAVNPLAVAAYPGLAKLLDGRQPTAAVGRLSTGSAELIPVDAQLGVPGRPQSATGQTAILTGVNAAQQLGVHYGPWPDARVRSILDTAGVFGRLAQAGRRGYFCNAYPQSFFDAVNRGRRLLSAVPYAAVGGGQSLLTTADLVAGRALAADFTNQAWRDHLGYADVPVYAAEQAGAVLWQIAQPYDFVFFEHWQTDILGHEQAFDGAVADLRCFDGFLTGLLAAADLAETLIIVSSDHGNVEECSHNRHTCNPALTLLLGAERSRYASRVTALTDFVPVILDYLGVAA